MFENLIAGWKLGSAIRKMVFQDRKLLLYPIISGIVILLATILVFASFFVVNISNVSGIELLVGLFIFYIIVYFLSVYVLVAMLLAFKSYKTKNQLGVFQSLAKASEYTVVILEWAIFEAIIAMIIRMIERRLGSVGGAIFGAVSSIALSIATLFAIPVIVDKKTGPIATITESSKFIVKNFGSTFGGLIYSELYSLIFTIIGIIVMIGAVYLWAIGSVPFSIGLVIGVLGLVVFAFGAMLSYTLSNVYRMVLYDYMNGGKLPEGIPKDLIKAGVQQKSQQSQNQKLPGGFV